MKIVFAVVGLMISALALVAAPDEYVTQTATGTTSATVYFEPGPRPARLVVADVTSDKAASVLNWRVGGQSMTILKAVPSTVTSNILCTPSATGAYGLNSNIVSVTASGTVTAHTAGTNSLVTNSAVTFHNPIGTNLAVNDRIWERLSTYLTVTGTNSATNILVSTNSTLVNGTLYLLEGQPDQLATNTMTSYTTNGANYVMNFTNAVAWTPQRIYLLATNQYTVDFAADRSAATVYVSSTTRTNLAALDTLVINPATGGTFTREVNTVADFIYQNQTISAATGIALAVGDRLFVLGTNNQTPVGAATLRLIGDPIRVIPANVPARLTVDGTSAVTINSATVRY